jgi:prolyl-tRNA editing enzyme YbaK/EbsC (Cys-tRNA(Pro) deacylase)
VHALVGAPYVDHGHNNLPRRAIIPRMDDPTAAVKAALDNLDVPFEVIDIDPEFADTVNFCARYGIPLERSANAIVVTSKNEPRQYACCVVLATTRLDVNHTVRRLMGVKKLSFAGADETAALTGMRIGGVTPVALPEGMPVYVDARVMEPDWIVIGSGSRSSKIKLSPDVFTRTPATEIVEGLAVPAN